jgi:hypothetical protein
MRIGIDPGGIKIGGNLAATGWRGADAGRGDTPAVHNPLTITSDVDPVDTLQGGVINLVDPGVNVPGGGISGIDLPCEWCPRFGLDVCTGRVQTRLVRVSHGDPGGGYVAARLRPSNRAGINAYRFLTGRFRSVWMAATSCRECL